MERMVGTMRWYLVRLTEKVSTACYKSGSDTAVCHARDADDAVRQLIPEMRARVLRITACDTMRDCYLAAGNLYALKDIVR